MPPPRVRSLEVVESIPVVVVEDRGALDDYRRRIGELLEVQVQPFGLPQHISHVAAVRTVADTLAELVPHGPSAGCLRSRWTACRVENHLVVRTGLGQSAGTSQDDDAVVVLGRASGRCP